MTISIEGPHAYRLSRASYIYVYIETRPPTEGRGRRSPAHRIARTYPRDRNLRNAGHLVDAFGLFLRPVILYSPPLIPIYKRSHAHALSLQQPPSRLVRSPYPHRALLLTSARSHPRQRRRIPPPSFSRSFSTPDDVSPHHRSRSPFKFRARRGWWIYRSALSFFLRPLFFHVSATCVWGGGGGACLLFSHERAPAPTLVFSSRSRAGKKV